MTGPHPTTRRPRRSDPDRRARILTSALDVVAEVGVAGVSHRRVATAADIPLGSMTYLFIGMDALLEEAFTAFADSVATRFHLYSFVIGTQPLHAVGMAMGMQRDGLVGNSDPAENGAALVYFGDGATSQGDVSEAFVFGASYTAPVVFFCQNNQWAISEPITVQSKIPLYKRAAGFGIPSIRVDGNDALAVHAVTEWALERARTGEGPTMIEAFTYRMGAHTTADDPTKYRRAEEEQAWKPRDPIRRVTTYLRSTGAIDDDWQAALDAESEELAVRLREGISELPVPTLDALMDTVYVEHNAPLRRQRDEYLAYEASFADAEGADA